MECDKCGFENADNLKYCGDCGNKLAISEPLVLPEPDKISKSELDQKRDHYAKNYKKIFNICFYTVIGFIAIFIMISFFRSPVDGLGTIMDIFINFWIWIFIVSIFIFRKTHKGWALSVSIIFGLLTILGAMGSGFNSW